MKTEKQGETAVQGINLASGDRTEDAVDASLVDRAQLVDECVGYLGKPAAARLKQGVERPFARRPGHGDDGDQRKRWSAITSGSLTTIHGRMPRCSWPIVGSSAKEHDRATFEL